MIFGVVLPHHPPPPPPIGWYDNFFPGHTSSPGGQPTTSARPVLSSTMSDDGSTSPFYTNTEVPVLLDSGSYTLAVVGTAIAGILITLAARSALDSAKFELTERTKQRGYDEERFNK